jgi:hypothetical protein
MTIHRLHVKCVPTYYTVRTRALQWTLVTMTDKLKVIFPHVQVQVVSGHEPGSYSPGMRGSGAQEGPWSPSAGC